LAAAAVALAALATTHAQFIRGDDAVAVGIHLTDLGAHGLELGRGDLPIAIGVEEGHQRMSAAHVRPALPSSLSIELAAAIGAVELPTPIRPVELATHGRSPWPAAGTATLTAGPACLPATARSAFAAGGREGKRNRGEQNGHAAAQGPHELCHLHVP